MRELVFKNLTSKDQKRRDLYMSEAFEKDGIRTVTHKHIMYIIGHSSQIIDTHKLLGHNITLQNPPPMNIRHVFIFKKRDTKAKTESLTYDVIGRFYAVIGNELYPIAFKQSFEIDFSVIA